VNKFESTAVESRQSDISSLVAHSSDTEVPQSRGWSVHVESGPHSGAVIPIKSSAFRVGSTLDSDLVIFGDGRQSPEVVVATTARGLEISTQHSNLLIDGSELVPGRSLRLRPGSVLSIGASRLRFDRADPRQIRAFGLNRLGLIIAASVVAIVGVSWTLVSATNRPLSKLASVRAATNTSVPALTSDSRQASLVRGLHTRLVANALNDDIQISRQGSALFATGAIASSQANSWLGTERWFDAHAAGGMMLVDRVHVLPSQVAPPISIGAVSTGATPYVITMSGNRYAVGANLPGGWVLERIDPDALVLERNGERVRETF
jgi:type III secretion protein D